MEVSDFAQFMDLSLLNPSQREKIVVENCKTGAHGHIVDHPSNLDVVYATLRSLKLDIDEQLRQRKNQSDLMSLQARDTKMWFRNTRSHSRWVRKANKFRRGIESKMATVKTMVAKRDSAPIDEMWRLIEFAKTIMPSSPEANAWLVEVDAMRNKCCP